MKRLIYILLAALAVAAVACQKMEEQQQTDTVQPSPEPVAGKMHKIDVTAGFSGSDTKTEIVSDGKGGYSFNWVAGDVVQVWEVPKNLDFAYDKATVGETSSKIEFPVEFEERVAAQYKYFGVYPGDYSHTGAFNDFNGQQKFRISIPPQQLLRNDCFDPSADLMVSKTVVTDKQPTSLNLQFGRVGAILQLVLRGMNDTLQIQSVKFQADVPIAGYTLFDPDTETYSFDSYNTTQYDNNYNPIPCNYINLYVNKLGDAQFDSGGQSMTLWLRCYPANLSEFTVQVNAGGRSPVTLFRRVNVAAHDGTSPVQLSDGKMTRLIVDMGKAIDPTGIDVSSNVTELYAGNNYQFTYVLTPLEAGAAVGWSTSDSEIATVDQFGKVTAVSAGEVFIKATCSSVKDSILVQVKETIPETVDLGLPSGTLWASCNLGAGSPTGYGCCYPWGDPIPNDKVSMSRYKFMNYYTDRDAYLGNMKTKYCFDGAYSADGTTDCKRYLDAEDDPATSHLGDGWRSPTNIEFTELNNCCTKTRGVIDGVNFVRFTSDYNGNSIIIPLSGYNGQTNRASEIRLWTCETIPSWYCDYIEEDGGVHTEVSQNITYWPHLGNNTTWNKWASAYFINASEETVSMTQKYVERYWHGYYIRPVKAGAANPGETRVRIKSAVCDEAGTSATVTLSLSSTPSQYGTYRIYKSKRSSSSSSGSSDGYSNLSNISINGNEVTGTLSSLTKNYEYCVYAYYNGNYSDNRVRFTAQTDPTKTLTAISMQETLNLKVGEKATLVPVYTPSTATITDGPHFIYNGGDYSVASVDNTGEVTANKAGTMYIMCYATGLSGQRNCVCQVTVLDPLSYGEGGSAGGDINDDDVNNGGSF